MVDCVLSQLKPSELYILSCEKGTMWSKRYVSFNDPSNQRVYVPLKLVARTTLWLLDVNILRP